MGGNESFREKGAGQMKIRIELVDSYRNLPEDYWQRLGAFYAENVWNMTTEEATGKIRDLFADYEAEYAVKWYEVFAYSKDKLVGCMRILRNPGNRTRWYFCDVHTGKKYRKKGVATAMYEKAIQTVETFYAAEYIDASISAENAGSIALHKKMGFYDTGKSPKFAHFWFEPDETRYERRLLLEYPARDSEIHRRILYKLYRSYQKSLGAEKPQNVAKEVKAMLSEYDDFRLVFCGNRAIGFRYCKQDTQILFVEEDSSLK